MVCVGRRQRGFSLQASSSSQGSTNERTCLLDDFCVFSFISLPTSAFVVLLVFLELTVVGNDRVWNIVNTSPSYCTVQHHELQTLSLFLKTTTTTTIVLLCSEGATRCCDERMD